MLDYGKKCVVIDLDETLVHSSFKVNQQGKQSVIFVIPSQWYWKGKTKRMTFCGCWSVTSLCMKKSQEQLLINSGEH